ncbi:MAG TPA: ATP-binding protein [Luteimonas sp.]|nr:ATP-binding protein [Luteimonas sp.]
MNDDSRQARRGGAAAALDWITRRQGREPDELRNTRMLAVLLVFMGLYQPLALVLRGWLRPWLPASPMAVVFTVVVTGIIWGCYLLLRRGRFNLAALLFLAVTLAALGLNYLRGGLILQVGTQMIALLPPLMGALLLGRWALWMCTAVLLAIIGGAAWADIARYFYDPVVVSSSSLLAAQFGAGVLAASLLLDRAAVVLSGHAREMAERNAQLARTRDRLQLEMREKDRAREQLVHAQKMEVAGRLASGVAHDFNHLLGLVMGYAGQGPDLDDVQSLRKALAGADSAARRAAAVSRQLLDFSRREPARLEAFDLVAALADMQPMLRRLCPPGIRVEMALQEAPLPVRFDRAQLELVLMNLAVNAAQAMGDAGELRISLALDEPDTVDVLVSDTGPGMTAEVRARCFEPFFTTKPSGQGTGLGLPVAASMVEASGGTLSVDDDDAPGCRMRVRVPRWSLADAAGTG